MRLAFLSIGRHIHTERWIRWFSDQGHECHLLTVQPGDVPGVTVHDIRRGFGPKPLRYAFSLAEVRACLKRLQPDLLNTHFLTGYGYWGHYSGFHPNVLTVWGDDVYVTPFENALKNRLARAALGSCDALTGDSADILAVSATLGADPERSFRVLWGVDFEVFRPADAEAWRVAHGFSREQIVYFSPRSYTQPYYNIDVVIEAAARVAAAEPRAGFVFSGYEGDPAPFAALVAKAGLTHRAVVVGRLPHAEFATALQACDVFISVPSVDATAVSLLEAMATGRAVIVSSLASACEWVTDGVSGRVVAPRAVDELAVAMLELAASDARRRELGDAALAVAREHAGFAANMRIVERIFAHVLEGTPWPREASLAALRPGKDAGPR